MSIIKTGIEVDTNSSFSNPTSFEENGVVSSINATGLTAETGYYVRAYVVDDQGNRIDSENTETFTTAAQPVISDYFYIQNEYNGGNTITLHKTGNPISGTTLSYSLDGNDWDTCTYDSNNDCNITLNNLGDKVYFRSSNEFNRSNGAYLSFSGDQNHSAGGDLRSLINYTNISISNAPTYCFYRAFYNDQKIISAEHLDFSHITNLDTDCYNSMFWGCTSLVNGPEELPATTLAQYCYYGMFASCTSLIESPILRATSLATDCYRDMFLGCSSLNKITTYVPYWNTSNASYWVRNVSSTGDFYNLGGASIPSGQSGIPTNWTEHTSL